MARYHAFAMYDRKAVGVHQTDRQPAISVASTEAKRKEAIVQWMVQGVYRPDKGRCRVTFKLHYSVMWNTTCRRLSACDCDGNADMCHLDVLTDGRFPLLLNGR